MKKIIEIKNLSKKYYTKTNEVTALKDINMDVFKGEFLTIIGPSGCGKSTLLSIIGEIEPLTSGSMTTIDDLKIGYMFQTDTLLDWLNVLDNCMLSLKIDKEVTSDKEEEVIKLLEKYGLGEFVYAYPSQLSGGMRQRTALIRTLVSKPNLVLLDEPFSALDFQSRQLVSDDVYKILKEQNITAIMVSHDISEAISMSDRVIILSNRPAVIKGVYDIKLDNPSTPINNKKDINFNKYFDILWKELDING